jgi:hypothetical protein
VSRFFRFFGSFLVFARRIVWRLISQ